MGSRRAADAAALLLAAGSAPLGEMSGRLSRRRAVQTASDTGLTKAFHLLWTAIAQLIEVRTIYHIFSDATFIPWMLQSK